MRAVYYKEIITNNAQSFAVREKLKKPQTYT
jgi:hypothetical protein